MLDRDIGQREQLRGEQLASIHVAPQPRFEIRIEEAPVLGDQHGGEHAERVGRQLVSVEWPERGGHDRDRRRGRVA